MHSEMLLYIFPWITLTSCIVTFASVLSGVQTAGQGGGTFITCDCTTTQCIRQGISACTTGGLCFVQYLDRRGQFNTTGQGHSPILVRGCTEGRTPLLCENRKPSRVKTWPLLHCCGTDFCNKDAVPTPAQSQTDGQITLKSMQEIRQNADIGNNSSPDGPSLAAEVAPPAGEESNPSSLLSTQKTRSTWPHIVGPVYISVVVVGIVSLVIIGIVAAAVIRRSNRFYAEHQYGSLQFPRRKMGTTAAHVVHYDCDSEIESVGSSLSYLHMVHPSRNT